jgi:phospholipid N-methyltransferase
VALLHEFVFAWAEQQMDEWINERMVKANTQNTNTQTGVNLQAQEETGVGTGMILEYVFICVSVGVVATKLINRVVESLFPHVPPQRPTMEFEWNTAPCPYHMMAVCPYEGVVAQRQSIISCPIWLRSSLFEP